MYNYQMLSNLNSNYSPPSFMSGYSSPFYNNLMPDMNQFPQQQTNFLQGNYESGLGNAIKKSMSVAGSGYKGAKLGGTLTGGNPIGMAIGGLLGAGYGLFK